MFAICVCYIVTCTSCFVAWLIKPAERGKLIGWHQILSYLPELTFVECLQDTSHWVECSLASSIDAWYVSWVLLLGQGGQWVLSYLQGSHMKINNWGEDCWSYSIAGKPCMSPSGVSRWSCICFQSEMIADCHSASHSVFLWLILLPAMPVRSLYTVADH